MGTFREMSASRPPIRQQAGVNSRLARAVVTAAMRRITEGRVDVLDGGRMRAYGRPGAGLHAQLTIDHPDAWSGPLRRQPRARRDLRRGALGNRRPRLAAADRRPRAAPSRGRRLRPGSAQDLGPPPARPGPREHPQRRQGAHLGPLRPRKRSLLRLPRPLDDLLVRLLRRRGDRPRGGADRQARPDLREAASRAGGSPARDRHRLGRAGGSRRLALRLPGDDDDDLPRASMRWRRSGCGPPASGTGSPC